MEPVNTFPELIASVLVNFERTYTTTGSLRDLNKLLDSLPDEEVLIHNTHICEIKLAISALGKFDRIITNKQFYILTKALKNGSGYTREKQKYGSGECVILKRDELYDIQYHDNLPEAGKELFAVKYETDDIVSETVFTLLSNMNRNLMGSTLNSYVYDYFAMMELLLNEDYNKYFKIHGEIKSCLMKYGWKCKDEKTEGGFQTEPLRFEMCKSLEEIVNKYF